jgi:hypothetical protein
MMAWGSSSLTALPYEYKAHGADGSRDRSALGGLQFKVRGAKFKGLVNVLLMPNDTYRVELLSRKYTTVGSRRVSDWQLKLGLDDVYCDVLMETIDRLIER